MSESITRTDLKFLLASILEYTGKASPDDCIHIADSIMSRADELMENDRIAARDFTISKAQGREIVTDSELSKAIDYAQSLTDPINYRTFGRFLFLLYHCWPVERFEIRKTIIDKGIDLDTNDQSRISQMPTTLLIFRLHHGGYLHESPFKVAIRNVLNRDFGIPFNDDNAAFLFFLKELNEEHRFLPAT